MKQALKKAVGEETQTWRDDNVHTFNLNNIGSTYPANDTGNKAKLSLHQALLTLRGTEKYTSGIEDYNDHNHRPVIIVNSIGKWSRLVWFNIGETLNHIIKKVKSRAKRPIFKEVVIHRPTDESALRQISKSIAAFRCTAALRYMDKLNFDDEQKAMVIDGLLSDLNHKPQLSLVTG